jgi:hypothetical protein
VVQTGVVRPVGNLAGCALTGLDDLGQLALLICGEEGDGPDLVEVLPD